MGPLARIAFLVALIVAATAAPAVAADFCVGLERDACSSRPTLAAAVESAAADGRDRIFLGPGDHRLESPAADAAGGPLEIAGAGAGTTRLLPAAEAAATLSLQAGGSWVQEVAVEPPEGAGAEVSLRLGPGATAYRVVLKAPGGAAGLAADVAGKLLSADVTGGLVLAGRAERAEIRTEGRPAVLAAPGDPAVAENLDIAVSGDAAALSAPCGATLLARHVTVTGAARAGGEARCAADGEGALLRMTFAIVAGDFSSGAFEVGGGGVVETRSSNYPSDPDVPASPDDTHVDPRFLAEGDHRLSASSPLIDRGGGIVAGEGFADAAGLMRATDGDGDGAPERDIGAHEHQPPVAAPSPANVLRNPGAEEGPWILHTGIGEEPAGWTRSGSFSAVGYGTTVLRPALDGLVELVELPTAAMGAALGGGRAFFSAGPGDGGALLQRVDVSGAAADIDAGAGTASVSGFLGGYGFDEDRVTLTATFRDPAGVELGRLVAGPLTPAARGNATGLLPRVAAGTIPPRTRAIDVEVLAERVGADGETYADAYADNLALVISVPGVPVDGPVDRDDPPVRGLRPFSGLTILTARPLLSRRGRTRIEVACASATVGRCGGTLELRAPLRRRTPAVRVARVKSLSLRPGQRASATLRLTARAHRALRGRRSFRAKLLVVARDGQALERRRTVPLVVRRAAPRR